MLPSLSATAVHRRRREAKQLQQKGIGHWNGLLSGFARFCGRHHGGVAARHQAPPLACRSSRASAMRCGAMQGGPLRPSLLVE
jgi:hypothetical protein